MDFAHSPASEARIRAVRAFVDERILPVEAEVFAEIAAARRGGDHTTWQVHPAIPALKAEAKAAGLWNLFLHGLSNVEYAPLAEEMGRSPLAPEVFNCNAPDSGNMELLERFATSDQKERWLKPLLNGSMRSAFCMTEPEVASSDATNIAATIRADGDDLVLNGRKWWSTGLGHPDCRLLVFLGVSDPDGPRHARHAMVLVPRDAPGVRIERMLSVFGSFDEPYGHGVVRFDGVRVPRSALLGAPGQGFAMAQARLGPGRIHHCMRCIGAAERAFTLMVGRSRSRVAFGRPLSELGGNRERLADLRVAIDQARLLTWHAAWRLDQVGAKGALVEISAIKLVAPSVLQRVADEAIQLFGAEGLSEDQPLTALFAIGRALRLADGPDAVHRDLIAKRVLAG